MLLKIAATQFACGDRGPVTYVVLDRRVGARSGANREERVIEQQQAKHETNRAPRKAHVSQLLGDIAHSLHFIIDAVGPDSDSSVRHLLDKHPRNERVAGERVEMPRFLVPENRIESGCDNSLKHIE